MRVTLERYKNRAENIRTFYFKPERQLDYTAGQFIELMVKHKNPDSRGQKRWFTLSSSPTQELLSITTKWADEKQSSYKKALWKLEPGSTLDMSEAMGDFVLPKLIQTKLVFVAGGIGITPFHSILNWLADTGEERSIKLIHAVRNEEEIIFQQNFERANIHATTIVSEPSSAWGGERGRLDAEKIIGLGEPDEDTLIYISGPEPMVESLEKDLKKAGIKPAQLVLDFFPNYRNI